jgi:hypothetical protein
VILIPEYNDSPLKASATERGLSTQSSLVMTSDKGKASKKAGDASGQPSTPHEGKVSNEPQRQRSLNG